MHVYCSVHIYSTCIYAEQHMIISQLFHILINPRVVILMIYDWSYCLPKFLGFPEPQETPPEPTTPRLRDTLTNRVVRILLKLSSQATAFYKLWKLLIHIYNPRPLKIFSGGIFHSNSKITFETI